MTPKQEAAEIYDKMKGFRVTNRHRKKCALVAVNMILNLGDRCKHWMIRGKADQNYIGSNLPLAVYEREYWEEAETELKNK